VADVVDMATRSRMMAGIRGRNTKPEILVRSLLHRQGFRFRLNVRELPGTPDIVLPRYRAAIFVHGCFWHGHDCPLYRLPGTRTGFWKDKIDRNRSNDQKASAALLAASWRVAVIWECALRATRKEIEDVAQRLGEWLRGNENEIWIRK
jgi:DNA mismatch endonuclease (patch repair protein)